MQELLNSIMPHLISIVTVLVGALATFITYKVNEFLKKAKLKSDNEMTTIIIDKVVAYVDQKLSDASNQEKFATASRKASEWLSTQGITISSTELEIMIEAAVNGAHKGLTQQTLLIEADGVKDSNCEVLPENNSEEVPIMEEDKLELANEINEPVVVTEEVAMDGVKEIVTEEEKILEIDELNLDDSDLISDGIDEETANEKLEEGEG